MPTSIGSEKAREFQKKIYFCFIDYAKTFDCVDPNKLWKTLWRFLRNLKVKKKNYYMIQQFLSWAYI